MRTTTTKACQTTLEWNDVLTMITDVNKASALTDTVSLVIAEAVDRKKKETSEAVF
jgi:hypothetical protein